MYEVVIEKHQFHGACAACRRVCDDELSALDRDHSRRLLRLNVFSAICVLIAFAIGMVTGLRSDFAKPGRRAGVPATITCPCAGGRLQRSDGDFWCSCPSGEVRP